MNIYNTVSDYKSNIKSQTNTISSKEEDIIITIESNFNNNGKGFYKLISYLNENSELDLYEEIKPKNL